MLFVWILIGVGILATIFTSIAFKLYSTFTLFENISTIGAFKAMGMTDKSISKVFLASSASTVLKGMAVGNTVAVAFCLLQGHLHILKLDPANYFVSFVPVNMNLFSILAVDVVSFVLIMVMLLIPCLFISRIDPSETVRVK